MLRKKGCIAYSAVNIKASLLRTEVKHSQVIHPQDSSGVQSRNIWPVQNIRQQWWMNCLIKCLTSKSKLTKKESSKLVVLQEAFHAVYWPAKESIATGRSLPSSSWWSSWVLKSWSISQSDLMDHSGRYFLRMEIQCVSTSEVSFKSSPFMACWWMTWKMSAMKSRCWLLFSSLMWTRAN